MAQFIKITLLILSYLFTHQVYADSHFKSEMINIEDVLVIEHGWQREQIGPMGLSYMIDIVGGKSVITLHGLIKRKLGGDINTPICSFFPKGREILFSKEGLNNFSVEKGKAARNKFVFQGEDAMTDADWAMADKYNWLSYISEGTGSDSPNQNILNKKMTITNCSTHNLNVTLDGKSYTFPNLILTMPMYVYLEKVDLNVNNKNVVVIDHNNKIYNLPIPYGFCDFTDTKEGKIYINNLNTMRKTQPLLPITYVVYGICEQLDEMDIYGHIALTANKNTKLKTQAAYNIYIKRFLDSRVVKHFLNQFEDINEKKIRQITDADVEIDINKPLVIFDNENVIINRIITYMQYKGKILEELVYTSATVLENTQVFYYIKYFEYEQGANKNIIAPIKFLANHSIKVKEMN